EVAGWRLTADIAVPFGAGPHPVLVYFHGGGWTMGSPRTHLRVGREFAAAGYLTLNLDYPRAPKHRFPAAFWACLFATPWAVARTGLQWAGPRPAATWPPQAWPSAARKVGRPYAPVRSFVGSSIITGRSALWAGPGRTRSSTSQRISTRCCAGTIA